MVLKNNPPACTQTKWVSQVLPCTYSFVHIPWLYPCKFVYMNHCTYEQRSQRFFTCKITLGYEERNIERWKTQREERDTQWSEREREGWENIREREKEKQWPFPDDICTNPVFESLLRSLNLWVWGEADKHEVKRTVASVHLHLCAQFCISNKHACMCAHSYERLCKHTLKHASSRLNTACPCWWDWSMMHMWTLKSM